MKHNWKAKLKKAMFGVYTYSNDILDIHYSPEVLAPYFKGRTYRASFYIGYYKYATMIPHSIFTNMSERSIERLLSSLDTGLNEAIVILSPYRASVLCAMLLVKTENPTRIRYTVQGIRGSRDFSSGEEDFSTSHRVPIFGLFEHAKNRVILSIEDQKTGTTMKKTIKIKTPDVLKTYFDIQVKMNYSKHDVTPEEEQFYEISGGYRGPTCVIDAHGNVRAFLARKPQYYGIYPMKEDHFLFSEHFLKRTTFGAPLSVVAHEMDWMGRYIHTYFHEIGYHHHAVELPDGNFLTISSSFYDKSVENKVIKIDRETGEELDSLSMDDLFDDTYKTRNDWCHVNSISPMDNPDELILCCRNIHSIIKVNMKEKKLIWIFSHPKMFEGTEQESLVLTPEEDLDPWFFQQHSAKIMKNYPNADPNRLYITFYDNHDAERRPVDWYDGPGTSYGLIVSIDEKARTVRLEKRFPTSYAITRANTYYDDKNNQFFTMDARLKDQTEKLAADIRVWDFDSGEMIREYTINQDFFAVHPINFNYKDLSTPLPDGRKLWRGELFQSSKSKKTPADFADVEIYPLKDIKFSIYGDCLVMWDHDQDLSVMYLIGKDEVYEINFARVAEGVKLKQPITKLRDNRFWHIMPMTEIPPGEYIIAFRHAKKLYRTERVYTIEGDVAQ